MRSLRIVHMKQTNLKKAAIKQAACFKVNVESSNGTDDAVNDKFSAC